MPELIPEIRDYRFGPDLAINDTNWDFVVVGDFASTDDVHDVPRRSAPRPDRRPDRPHASEQRPVRLECLDGLSQAAARGATSRSPVIGSKAAATTPKARMRATSGAD